MSSVSDGIENKILIIELDGNSLEIDENLSRIFHLCWIFKKSIYFHHYMHFKENLSKSIFVLFHHVS